MQDRCAVSKARKSKGEIIMDSSVHFGHRRRIDEKAKDVGLEFLPAHEQLEKILFVAIPRGNTNEIAHSLLNRFKTLYGVITADVEELVKTPGVGRRVAEYLHDLTDVLGIVERCELMKSKTEGAICLNTIEDYGKYMCSLFHGATSERFFIASLNSQNRVLRFDKVADGAIDEIQICVRNIVKTALINEAYAIIIAHNHPGGKAEPSLADIDLTRKIAIALSALNIQIRDHIVISDEEWRSMNEMGIV